MIGVEPTWIAPPDPKSGASANFATSGLFNLNLVCLLPNCVGGHIRLKELVCIALLQCLRLVRPVFLTGGKSKAFWVKKETNCFP